MVYHNTGMGMLDYMPCRYGASRLQYRGPRANLDGDYIACIGGTETYGKFVEKPYSVLLKAKIGVETVNLGFANAGTDVFNGDATVKSICDGAKATVLQVTGAQNMSNRFYAVHPRRNDRFLRASPLLQAIYQNIDFNEINFTGHLLTSLQTASPESFKLVRQELKEAWVARMRRLIESIQSDVVLLWLSDHSYDDRAACDQLGSDPTFVDGAMIAELAPHVRDIVEIVGTRAEIEAGFDQLIYTELEAPSAREMLGPVVHARAAEALAVSLP